MWGRISASPLSFTNALSHSAHGYYLTFFLLCVCVSSDMGFDRPLEWIQYECCPSLWCFSFFFLCAESRSLRTLQSKANESNYCQLITCLNPCPLLTPEFCTSSVALLKSLPHISPSLFCSLRI